MNMLSPHAHVERTRNRVRIRPSPPREVAIWIRGQRYGSGGATAFLTTTARPNLRKLTSWEVAFVEVIAHHAGAERPGPTPGFQNR